MSALKKMLQKSLAEIRAAASSGDEDLYYDTQAKFYDFLDHPIKARDLDPGHRDPAWLQGILDNIHDANQATSASMFSDKAVVPGMEGLGPVWSNFSADELSDLIGELFNDLAPFQPGTRLTKQ